MNPRPCRRADAIRGELPDGEVVISVPGADRALILNAVADAVLELCDGTRTIAEIGEFVRATVSVPRSAEVERDIERVLEQLAAAGVVE